jgi:virginiamycin A acetyltransferase
MGLFRDRDVRGDTVVGNDVWLGYQSLVMPGVRIGDGAVVAARSVVAGDVPPYAVVAGNPARVVRHRFPADRVRRLLDIAWWHWPPEVVSEHLDQIMSASVDGLAAVAAERAGPEQPVRV